MSRAGTGAPVPRLWHVQLAMVRSSWALQSWDLSNGRIGHGKCYVRGKIMKIQCEIHLCMYVYIYIVRLSLSLYTYIYIHNMYITFGLSIAMFDCQGLMPSANLPAATVELLIAQAWVWAHRAMAKKKIIRVSMHVELQGKRCSYAMPVATPPVCCDQGSCW